MPETTRKAGTSTVCDWPASKSVSNVWNPRLKFEQLRASLARPEKSELAETV